MLINQLSFLILTGDQSLSLFSSLSSDDGIKGGGGGVVEESPRHRRNSSRGSIRGFIPPEEPLTFTRRWVWFGHGIYIIFLHIAIAGIQ